ncbi:MAG: hypothetical protein JW902_13025, partial [Syntrophaceae bacterium]|nr:hypothetical protein [Syntrophaceae bacterium]
RDGAHLDTGVLTAENKLDGEGPFRVVVPQKYVEAPDQSSTSSKQDVLWPYNEDWDHNAGSCTRTVTAIKVEPLPEGTTDIDLLETGWNYVDQSKIIVYGAIDGADSNGNGILDSEERNGEADFDGDGAPDYQDPDTAYPRHAEGTDHLLLHASKGAFAGMAAVSCSDPMIPQEGKPAGRNFPYGAVRYNIVGLNPGEEVTVTYVFPYNVPVSAKIYIVHDRTGWVELPFESNDGDNIITVALKDGDNQTDGDGLENGVIVDPITLSTSTGTETTSSGGGGSCFVSTLTNHPGLRLGTEIVLSMVVLLIIGIVRRNAVK